MAKATAKKNCKICRIYSKKVMLTIFLSTLLSVVIVYGGCKYYSKKYIEKGEEDGDIASAFFGALLGNWDFQSRLMIGGGVSTFLSVLLASLILVFYK